MNRNPIYDRAKGLGIILVVYGHLFKYGSLPFSIIFSFHMPLFLIISGVLFTPPNWKNIEDRRKWYKKIFVRYTIPFAFFSFLGGFARYIIDGIVNYRVAAKEFLHNIGSDEMMTGALWFIGLLAIAMIILPILLTYDRGKSKRMVFVIFLLTLISYLCDTTRHMSHFPILPFRLRSLSAVVMYLYLGHILKKPIARMIYCSFKFKIIFFVAFPLFFVLACMNQTVNIAVPVYHDLLIYIYCSLYGTIFFINILPSFTRFY